MARKFDVGGCTLALENYRCALPRSAGGFKPTAAAPSVRSMDSAAFQERAPWRANLFRSTSSHSASDKTYTEDDRQIFVKEMAHAHVTRPARRMPAAWGALLTREDLADYLAMSVSTLVRILPVRPLDLGVRGVRYRRADIDDWLATLPIQGSNRLVEDVEDAVAITHRPSTALEKVLARSAGRRNRQDVVA